MSDEGSVTLCVRGWSAICEVADALRAPQTTPAGLVDSFEVRALRERVEQLDRRNLVTDEAHAEAVERLEATQGLLAAAEVRAEAAEARVAELEAEPGVARFEDRLRDLAATAFLDVCHEVERVCAEPDPRVNANGCVCDLPKGHPGDHWSVDASPSPRWSGGVV